MLPVEDILEMQRLFEESKKDEKKKTKKQGEEEEIFKFGIVLIQSCIQNLLVFPEFLEYELGGPPLRTIEVKLLFIEIINNKI
jgi:hypothetical protein